MRKIRKIIVHCSGTVEGRDVSVESIRDYHVRERGWSDIGYHYVITLDGVVHKGRRLSEVGAHCLGHNHDSIGVCYVGGLDAAGNAKDTRTAAQRRSLRELIRELRMRYVGATVHGHNEFSSKACPCFDVQREGYE